MTSKITRAILEGYLACKLKGYLTGRGEAGDPSAYTTSQADISAELRAQAVTRLRRRFGEEVVEGVALTEAVLAQGNPLLLGVTLEDEAFALTFDGLARADGGSRLGTFHYTPVLAWGGSKVGQDQRHLLAWHALLLADVQGRLPEHGLILSAGGARATRVRLAGSLRRARRSLAELRGWAAGGPGPAFALNRHCPACVFRDRCHVQAVKDDHLSLLRGISEQEIARQNNKGIFTVRQLSYTFRPRRRPRRARAGAVPHSFALQALALREQKVYVQGPLSLPTAPTRLYLDLEGVPDRGLYYLAGLLVATDGAEERHWFWADGDADQAGMFAQLLDLLARYPDADLFHYGSYEARALRQLQCRLSEGQRAHVERLLGRAVNVLTLVHAHVYLPTYSNGLKEVGGYLGCRWSDPDASGVQSLVWRAQWERTGDDAWKERLVRYNAEDCQALKAVVDFLTRVAAATAGGPGQDPGPDFIPVEALRAPGRRPLFRKQEEALPGFAYLNECAYFEYQRQRVFVRTAPHLRALYRRRRRTTRVSRRANKVVELDCKRCPHCGSRKVHRLHAIRRQTIDLTFARAGVKKWVVRYLAAWYACAKCGATFLPEEFPRSPTKYGRGLASWCVYQNVACGQNMLQVRRALADVFRLPLGPQQFSRFKTAAADYFRPAYDAILAALRQGGVLHADETEVALRGRTGYVWVLANTERVYFFYRDSREASFLADLLKPFAGVLVSDFFTGYDALPCPQQKCLIHLLRDLNEDVFRNPFDQELAALAQGFAALLQRVVRAVDRHGLRTRFLARYRVAAEAYFDGVCAEEARSDLARGYQKRFEKYRAKLFTFLDHDGVPWNNNNAEHAVHCFARYRMFADGRFTEASLRDYLVLLSLYQTREYQGVGFLDYLRHEQVGGRADFGVGTRPRCRKQAAPPAGSAATEAEEPRGTM